MGKRLIISIFISVLLSWVSSCTWAFLVIFPAAYILFGGGHVVWRLKQTLWRDIQLLIIYISIGIIEKKGIRNNITYHKKWQSLANKQPNKVAIYFQDEQWTYIRIVSLANKMANYLSSNSGLEVGDTVVLIGENCPEYLVALIALSMLGCPVALIKYDIRGTQLSNYIKLTSCKAVIVYSSLSEYVKQIEGELSPNILYYSLCRKESDPNYKNIIQLSQDCLETALVGRDSKIAYDSTLCYIYTSGTTGPPKVVVISHLKTEIVGEAMARISNVSKSDILYATLPLSHSSGLILSTGTMVATGSSMYLKSKFIASECWNDCITYNCTVIIYIGELCRYLLLEPKRPSDTRHKVTKAFGNGLRKSVWHDFKDRFKISNIVEMYGSTEGSGGTMNLIGEPGFVGYVPISVKDVPILRIFHNLIFLAKLDPETGEPLRSADGLCIRCDVNEAGEVLGITKVGRKKIVIYLSEEETNKKVIRNVVTQGDTYARTGDIMSANELGFLTFLDRRSDTYYWKGEYVSTSEVESIITSVIGNADVIVYSVVIPGTEGRAGMAAIVKNDIDMKSLLDKLNKALPSYSVPIFIRISSAAEVSYTFKYNKLNLKKEGFDINTVTEPIFFLDPRCNRYVPLDKEVFSLLMESKLRL